MRKKWSDWDVFIFILEVLAAAVSIIIICFTPAGQELDADTRLSIIGVSIAINFFN